jgi:hypothetical protein
VQSTGFEFGNSNVTQLGSCWFAGPNDGAHQWGGTNKATIISDAASDGWIHHCTVRWNCGGWGIFDRTQRTVVENNHMICTAPNNATHGVIEGGSAVPVWDGYHADRDGRFWSIARNAFSRPVMNGVCPNPTPEVNCTGETGVPHQNWGQRETLTTDGPGEVPPPPTHTHTHRKANS